MHWPAWDIFAAGGTLLDCRVIAPSDLKKFLVQRVKLLRWEKKQIDEMENGAWIELIRTFLGMECDWEWTQDKKNRAKQWVINGAVKQDAMCMYVWCTSARCAEDLRLRSIGCITVGGGKT